MYVNCIDVVLFLPFVLPFLPEFLQPNPIPSKRPLFQSTFYSLLIHRPFG
jgi:hypothetical protein